MCCQRLKVGGVANMKQRNTAQSKLLACFLFGKLKNNLGVWNFCNLSNMIDQTCIDFHNVIKKEQHINVGLKFSILRETLQPRHNNKRSRVSALLPRTNSNSNLVRSTNIIQGRALQTPISPQDTTLLPRLELHVHAPCGSARHVRARSFEKIHRDNYGQCAVKRLLMR